MRRIAIALTVSLVAAACSSSLTSDTSETSFPTTTVVSTTTAVTSSIAPTSSTTTTSTTTAPADTPPLLADHRIEDVEIGDQTMRLAIADSPELRATGLMGVTDLGDLDGMLFYWRHDAAGGFWMKNTLIPLDIVWFDIDGFPVGRASMIPCESDPCPSYSPGDDIIYRYAIEANPGDLDWVTNDTVLIYQDQY